MAAVSFKCPNCGGDLRFDPATQSYKCEYCMSSFDQGQLEAANPQAAPESSQDGKASSAEDHTDAHGAVVYSCPSCGAEIVADEETAATFCYYCHNPVVLQGRLSGTYAPDLVIPFAVDKKEAVDSFLKYVRAKRFVPRDFFCKEQIEKISGVYFPFWMYSCKADTRIGGEATKLRVYVRGDVEFTETQVFHFERDADLDFERLMRNALDSDNRELVEAVQPFQVEQAKPFSMGYLSGFQAQKRNLESTQLSDDVRAEVEKHAQQMVRGSVSGYSSVQVKDSHVRIHDAQWKYLLLPVWVLTYRGGDDKTYYYVMNGQTRKVCGVLPLAKGRMIQFFASIAVPLMILLMIGGYFLW